ncbi:MAG: ankyrin repeat domain-containing protein [Vulcanimicrobiota bacterium]
MTATRFLSKAFTYTAPAAIITASVASAINLCVRNIFLGLAMLPGTFVIMAGVGVAVGMVAKYVFRQGSQQVQDITILSGLILGGATGLVALAALGAQPAWAAGGAVVGGIGGLGFLGLSAQRSLSRELASRNVLKRVSGLSTTHQEDLEGELSQILLDCEMALGSFHPATATVVLHLADFYAQLRRVAAAETLYKRALGIYQEVSGDTAVEQSDCLHQMAKIYLNRESDQAITVARRALALRTQKGLADTAEGARIRWTLAQLYGRNDKFREAVEEGEKAMATLEARLGPSHPETVSVCRKLAEFCQEAGQTNTALALLTGVLKRREQTNVPGDAQLVELLASQARIEKALGRPSYQETFVKALAALKQFGGPDHPMAGEIVESVGDHLAKPEWDDQSRAFWDAISQGDQRKAKIVLDEEPEVGSLVDTEGWTAFHWCAFWDLERILESLLFRGVKMPESEELPALLAARWGRRKILATLLSRGADIEASDASGSTVLHQAVISGDVRTVEVLSHRKVKLETRDANGLTPLHLSVKLGLDTMLVELMARGASIETVDDEGNTPLHTAVTHDHFAVAQCLLFNGASPLKQDARGRSALDLAEELGRTELHGLLATHKEES